MLNPKLIKMGMAMAGYSGWRADTVNPDTIITITYVKHGEPHTVAYTAAQVCTYITEQSPIPLAPETPTGPHESPGQ